MDTNRIKKVLNSETSVKASNTDVNLKVNIDAKERLLPPDKINHVVDAGVQFNTERQSSPFYRILSTINPLVSNVLFNLNNTTNADLYTWAAFNYRNPTTLDYRFLDRSYPKDNDLQDLTDLTYSDAIKKYLKEIEGWFGYFDPDITQAALCNFFDMEPKRQRFSFIPDIDPYNCGSNCKITDNWNITITYPATADTTHYMIKDGLFIFDRIAVNVSGRDMTAFGTPVLHNLVEGDIVRLTGTTIDGDYTVVRDGLDNGDLKGYYFVIDTPPLTSSPISINSRMRKVVGGQPSTYYFRKFRKIKTKNTSIIELDDNETYKLAFSENIYADSISQVVFNEDIMVSGLTDNLGRPLSELYLTIIKTSSNNLFSNVSSGIETPFMIGLNNSVSSTFSYLRKIPTINKIHNGGTGTTGLPYPSHLPLELSVSGTNNNGITNNNDYYGDVVEYNGFTVKETVLADVCHRFNTINRETAPTLNYVKAIGATPVLQSTTLGPRQEGYYYKPHNLIKIREFSSYVEQGDSNTFGIPSYAQNLGDGRYLWRDLLDIGFNESDVVPLDYPFLNGCHYRYSNTYFNVRRQDPFGNWGLYYSKFPADPIGDATTNKFTVNSADNVC